MHNCRVATWRNTRRDVRAHVVENDSVVYTEKGKSLIQPCLGMGKQTVQFVEEILGWRDLRNLGYLFGHTRI